MSVRNAWIRVKVLLYWLIGHGPWLVVGQYYDDEGNLRRFRTGYTFRHSAEWHTYESLDEANDYCSLRNEQAMTDPLGTTYYVWHELEFNLYKENSR